MSTPRTLRPRELAGQEQRRLAGAGAEVEDPLGVRGDRGRGGRERREVVDRAGAGALVPARGASGRRSRASAPRSSGHSHGARATAPFSARPMSRIAGRDRARRLLHRGHDRKRAPGSAPVRRAVTSLATDAVPAARLRRCSPRSPRVALSACGGGDDASTTAATAAGRLPARSRRRRRRTSRFTKPGKVLKPGEPATATVETSCGTFVIELDTKHSPKTVELVRVPRRAGRSTTARSSTGSPPAS